MSSQDANTTILDNTTTQKSHGTKGDIEYDPISDNEKSRIADAQSETVSEDDSFDVQRLEELVATKERDCGRRHPETLDTMLNLEMAYRFNGFFEESEKVLQKVVTIMKEDLGEDHRDTLVGLTKVAEVKAALGHEEEAEQMQLSILETRRKVLGEHDLDTINSMEQIAIWYGNKGEHFKSEHILREAVKFHKRVVAANNIALGENDAETIASAESLKHAERTLAEVTSSNNIAEPPPNGNLPAA